MSADLLTIKNPPTGWRPLQLNFRQAQNVQQFMEAMAEVAQTCDEFTLEWEMGSNDDDDAVFWRKTQTGLTSLMFGPYGGVAVSYIGKIAEPGNDFLLFYGYDEEPIDFETVVYLFLKN